jgi:hypothetical protein
MHLLRWPSTRTRLCKRSSQVEKRQQSLRAPTPQPGGKKAEVTKSYVGDTKDGYLRGLAGGEAHPHFDPGSRKRYVSK